MKEKDIKIFGRSYQFAFRVVKMGQQLPESNVARIIGTQLLRVGTSVGANIEEAVGVYSKLEFTHKMSIALKEAREAHYWLRLLRDADIMKPIRLGAIIAETEEIKNILGAIVRTARMRTQ